MQNYRYTLKTAEILYVFIHFFRQRSFYLNPLGNPVYDSYETSHRPVVSFVKKGFYEQMRNFAGIQWEN